jgi:hypothetical protein
VSRRFQLPRASRRQKIVSELDRASLRPTLPSRTLARDMSMAPGRHTVGERAVEITQLAAIAIAAQTPVDHIGTRCR